MKKPKHKVIEKWVAERRTLLQGLLIIFALMGSLISGYINNQTAMMIILLSFIACEFFLLVVVYLEQILSYIKNKKDIFRGKSGNINYIKDIIQSAESSVFISGSSLSSLNYIIRELNNLSKKIYIEMYNINPKYLKDNSSLCNIINCKSPDVFRKDYEFFKEHVLDCIKGRENTDIFSIDFVSPITYIGIDIDVNNSNSKILAEHYIFGEDYDLSFAVEAGSDLYGIYYKQLSNIRNQTKTKLN